MWDPSLLSACNYPPNQAEQGEGPTHPRPSAHSHAHQSYQQKRGEELEEEVRVQEVGEVVEEDRCPRSSRRNPLAKEVLIEGRVEELVEEAAVQEAPGEGLPEAAVQEVLEEVRVREVACVFDPRLLLTCRVALHSTSKSIASIILLQALSHPCLFKARE